MPKVIPTIPDELILTKFSELDAVLPLTPKQVAMILGKTEAQLQEARKAGSGPRFDQNGGRVRYYIGQVRDYLRDRMENHTYLTTREAKIAEENRQAGFDVQAAKRQSGLGFASLDQFLMYAEEGDVWPFAFVDGIPVDFFKSLGVELSDRDECCWLSVGEYLQYLNLEKRKSINAVK
jgi:hypothetical protein